MGLVRPCLFGASALREGAYELDDVGVSMEQLQEGDLSLSNFLGLKIHHKMLERSSIQRIL
jgi:hypothetical protein